MFACKLSRHHTDRSYRKNKYTHGATLHTGDITFLKSVTVFQKNIQIANIANGRTNEHALSAILPVEQGYNIN